MGFTFKTKCRLVLIALIFGLLYPGRGEARGCAEFLRKINRTALSDANSWTTLEDLFAERRPVVIAHGKNSNVSEESTWRNYEHSIRNGADVLEFDVWITQDGQPIVLHDPTFHRISKDYRTSREAIDAFVKAHPKLASEKQSQWDFLLFDRVSSHPLKDIRDHITVFDKNSENEYGVIALSEILEAIRLPGAFRIPAYDYRPRGPPEAVKTEPAKTIPLDHPVFYYVDFKDSNVISRLIDGLSVWDWERASWSYGDLYAFTTAALQNVVRTIEERGAVDKCIMVARHPLIAKILLRTNPDIKVMASSDRISQNSSAEEVISEMEMFASYGARLFEVKFLKHIRSPDIRAAAKRLGYKLLYNEITQTDPSQFEGTYHGNLAKLLTDILEPGADILIQTNTVREVRDYVDSRFGAQANPPASCASTKYSH